MSTSHLSSQLIEAAKALPRPLVVVITGPTASGKSALAVDVARALGTEIVCADSRQMYRGMPVTTAVPTLAERGGVKHHLLECLDVTQQYSAGQFETDALALVNDLLGRYNGVAVVCGGSMLYIDALLHGIDELPTISPEVRYTVASMRQQHGMKGLLAYLQIVDPDYYEALGTQGRVNPRRVTHAIEVTMQAGVPYSSLLTGERKQRSFATLAAAIRWPRETLYERINMRVQRMIEQGMAHEAHTLYPQRGLPALDTVGIREWFDFFDGKLPLSLVAEKIARNTRVYAKKQIAWLKRNPDLLWLNP